MIYGKRDWSEEERAAYARGDTPLADALGEVLRLRALLEVFMAGVDAVVTDLNKSTERKSAGLRVAPVNRDALSEKLGELSQCADPELDA